MTKRELAGWLLEKKRSRGKTRETNKKTRATKKKKAVAAKLGLLVTAKLTSEQIDLASRYLATSNLCTLERYKSGIKDLPTLKSAVQRAEHDAIGGAMEGLALEDGGVTDRYESEAIHGYEQEVESFKEDFERSNNSAAYWIKLLHKEIPFLFS